MHQRRHTFILLVKSSDDANRFDRLIEKGQQPDFVKIGTGTYLANGFASPRVGANHAARSGGLSGEVSFVPLGESEVINGPLGFAAFRPENLS